MDHGLVLQRHSAPHTAVTKPNVWFSVAVIFLILMFAVDAGKLVDCMQEKRPRCFLSRKLYNRCLTKYGLKWDWSWVWQACDNCDVLLVAAFKSQINMALHVKVNIQGHKLVAGNGMMFPLTQSCLIYIKICRRLHLAHYSKPSLDATYVLKASICTAAWLKGLRSDFFYVFLYNIVFWCGNYFFKY